MYYPLSGIGLGQHSPSLWREHMHVLSRMRNIGTPPHGFGTASGTSSFDVTGAPSTTQPCITYMAHPDISTQIHKGSPVVLSNDILANNTNFWPGCITQDPITITNIGTPIGRGGASVGWPNETATTNETCTQSVFGDLSACAISLTTTPGGSIGYAYIANRCAAYVLRHADGGDEDGLYAHVPTMAEIATASGKSALISGALVRRHCGLWKILQSNTVYEEDGTTDLGIDLCLLERQPHRHRWFIADLDGVDATSTDYIKKYLWHESATVDEEATDFAYNLVEEDNDGTTGNYVSDQLFDNIGDWSMLQARGKAFIRLDINEGVYSARFSRASQFMGDCWDL